MAPAYGMFFPISFQWIFIVGLCRIWSETLGVQKASVKSVNFSMMYLFFSQKIIHYFLYLSCLCYCRFNCLHLPLAWISLMMFVTACFFVWNQWYHYCYTKKKRKKKVISLSWNVPSGYFSLLCFTFVDDTLLTSAEVIFYHFFSSAAFSHLPSFKHHWLVCLPHIKLPTAKFLCYQLRSLLIWFFMNTWHILICIECKLNTFLYTLVRFQF